MAYDDAFDDDYEAYDDAFDDAFDDGDGEAVASRSRNRGRSSPRPAIQTRPYARGVQGRATGVIETPNGKATVQLPGRFPTVTEFRGTLEEVHSDIKKNSEVIRALGRTNDDQDARLLSLSRSVRRSGKLTFWSSIIFGAITIGPHLLNALQPRTNNQ
jgi:hypothetical protein